MYDSTRLRYVLVFQQLMPILYFSSDDSQWLTIKLSLRLLFRIFVIVVHFQIISRIVSTCFKRVLIRVDPQKQVELLLRCNV